MEYVYLGEAPDVLSCRWQEEGKKKSEMAICPTPTAKMERTSLRKGKGLSHIFTGHKSGSIIRAAPPKCSSP